MEEQAVYYTAWNNSQNMLQKTDGLYQDAGIFDIVAPGDLVAIKLHVGELGNPNYIRPFFIKQIVEQVEKRGGKPFLTDTTTYYPLLRNNAVDHMQTAVSNGFGFAPFIVADGLQSENGVLVASSDPLLDEIYVAGAISEADAMIVVSHLKGHALTGFGGSIKNLGMGGVTKKTKLAQHRQVDLHIDQDLCEGCGTCVDVCWLDVPRIENGLAVIDDPRCMRCPICSNNCPQGAISLSGREKLSQSLAVATKGVMDTFDPGKVSFVTFATDVVSVCDCAPVSGEPIWANNGILTGFSPLSIDAASLNLIDHQALNRMHNHDCWYEVRKMKELGDHGSMNPRIVDV